MAITGYIANSVAENKLTKGKVVKLGMLAFSRYVELTCFMPIFVVKRGK